jgi:hypothetical protein
VASHSLDLLEHLQQQRMDKLFAKFPEEPTYGSIATNDDHSHSHAPDGLSETSSHMHPHNPHHHHHKVVAVQMSKSSRRRSLHAIQVPLEEKEEKGFFPLEYFDYEAPNMEVSLFYSIAHYMFIVTYQSIATNSHSLEEFLPHSNILKQGQYFQCVRIISLLMIQ